MGAVFLVGMGNLEGVIHGLYSAGRLPEPTVNWLSIPQLASDPQSGSFYPGHDYYNWWWWRGSRVIDDVNLLYEPIGAQPISEFPFFSFLLGDNHPHKLALPFVLLAIGLALNLLLAKSKNSEAIVLPEAVVLPEAEQLPEESATQPATPTAWVNALQAQWSRLARWLFYALALGALGFLNTWDFPIYLGLVVLAYGLGTFHAQGYFTRANLLQTVKLGLGLGFAAVLLYLLFYLSFSSQAGGILPYVFPPTRLPQYAIIFGPFLFALAFFLAAAVLHGQGAGRGLRRTGMVWGWLALLTYGPFLLVIGAAVLLLSRGSLPIAGIDPATLQEWAGGMAPDEAFMAVITARLLNPWTFVVISLLMSLGIAALLAGRSVVTANAAGMPAADEPAAVGVSLPPAGLFAALLAVVGLALTLSVEFLYLRDSFGVRMNTVFKFYFQGWILMALASAYAAWWFIQCSRANAVVRAGFATGLAVLTAAGLVFSGMGIYTRTHGFSFPPDLNAGATMAGSYPGHWNAFPDDWKAIQWLNANVQGVPVILEAPGGGYEHNGRISAFTGFPTLLGWSGHEYQWRGDNVIQDQRRPEIEAIFSTPDGDQALAMLQSWQVRYVIIGETEQEYIQSVCQSECNPQRALQKFKQVLSPVFSAGSTTIYQVPGSRR
jgi:YYY domain-containing protein